MDGIEIFDTHSWHPFSYLGLTSPLLALQQHTLIHTWIALGIILLFACAGHIALIYFPNSLLSYMLKKYVQLFVDAIEQSCHLFSYQHTAFIISLFTFLVVCNCLVIIPTLEEPTKDLNTTLALAIIAFIYVQSQGAKVHGLVGYLNEYFKTPFAVRGRHHKLSLWTILDTTWRVVANCIVAILAFPIELLGKMASILSLSFRLFGNIFGGSVISSLWLTFTSYFLKTTLGIILLPVLHLFHLVVIIGFFGLFEGLLQATVFSMLTIMYLGNAIAQHPEEGIS